MRIVFLGIMYQEILYRKMTKTCCQMDLIKQLNDFYRFFGRIFDPILYLLYQILYSFFPFVYFWFHNRHDIKFVQFPTRCYVDTFLVDISIRIESNKYNRSMVKILRQFHQSFVFTAAVVICMFMFVNFHNEDMWTHIQQQIRSSFGTTVLYFFVSDPSEMGKRLCNTISHIFFFGFVISCIWFIGK